MRLTRRHLILTLPTLAATGRAWGEVRGLSEAINKAGRQRMLSQRAAKAYLALGQRVRPEQAEKVLAESMALFERQLAELKAFAPTDAVRQLYAQLQPAWAGYRTALTAAPASRPGADAVLAGAGQVLRLAHLATLELEKLSGHGAGRLVNLSGRQRMLSQRMGALYLGASWGIQPAANVKQLDGARAEFVQAHQQLKAAPETTAAIRAELDMAEQQFGFFESALRTLHEGQAGLQASADVFTTSERILQLMEGVTGLYASLD